ncbi:MULTISPECIES: TetR/AcrR family transcriptional regulator [Vibrio]|uniref:TetR/AcrR family transcriptional regulator n=1 Tax=Vibrio TaxID=662 RepID=UPI001267F7A3|nr:MULTISPECIES: TetR/AcrR family transcriptional regulator [Vibrio]MCM5509993.1 TetR/AcrR family transcriptional regulator [Vibrio sp. SCSIO 43169]QFT39947.1 HTH-type transcriptional repressor AcnR [Vibrio sp. THAF64]QGM37546.1 HTH-type transcriptional repressor AcnR [Vibrio sp. THAF191d]QGN73271.1 HTH-type transcriptional repressor AcnR [Vibrio sp. THAF191c]WFB51210.1 TetR/AcrR family transcriptional regulator [Vibrio coralliilyticus]
MPKIVDHEAYRKEIVTKAVTIFSEHGYHGLGMRKIAQALGMSKGALYYYFSTKEALFTACTESVLEPSSLYGLSSGEPVPENKQDALRKLVSSLDLRFKGEMTVLLDYVKNRDRQQLADDVLLKMSDERLLLELEKWVGKSNAQQALALLMGGLLMRLLSANPTPIDTVVSWITALSE